MDLSVKFGKVRFKNPIIASGGTPTLTSRNMRKCIEAGVAGIEWKSISYDKGTYHLQRPASLFLDKFGEPGSAMSWETGFPSPELGLEQLSEIKPLAEKEDVRLILNLDGGNLADWYGSGRTASLEKYCNYAKKLQQAGADILQIGLCPIVGANLGEERFGWLPGYTPEAIKTLRQAGINIPITIKIDETFSSARGTMKTLEKARVDGMHIGGFMPGTLIDIETAKPLAPGAPLAYGYGRARKAYTNYVTSVASSTSKIPLASSGGISTTRDVVERLMCGATLAAVCTAAMYRGYKVFTEMVRGLEKFMDRKGYQKVAEFIGIAVPYIESHDDFYAFLRQLEVPKDSVTVTVDPERCNGCERCMSCLYGAITMEEGIARIDPNVCERCGICSTICPVSAITEMPWPYGQAGGGFWGKRAG